MNIEQTGDSAAFQSAKHLRSASNDDDMLARRGAGLDVGLGVTDLFQAVVDLRDRDFEAPCGDGLELVGEDVGRKVGGLTAVGRQPHPVGAHSDRVGRKRMLLAGVLIGVFLAIPAFAMMGSGSLTAAMIGALLVMVSSAIFSQSYASTLPEQFPTEARSSALGLAYNAGNAAFGGTAPLVVGTLVASTGNAMVPAYYLVGAALLGLLSLTFLKETSARPLHGSLPNVAGEEEARRLVATQESNRKLDHALMPLPYVAFALTSDGQVVQLSSQDPEVRRAAAAAGLKLNDAASR